mgnify:CR=1 FL=1
MFILVVELCVAVAFVLNTVGRLELDSGPTEVAFAAVIAAMFVAATWGMAISRSWFSGARADPPNG